MLCNFGLKLYLWFQIELALRSFNFEITRMISAQIALHSVQLPLLIRHVMRIERTINKGIPSIHHETKFSKWNYQLKPYHITAINITAVVSLPDNNCVLDSDYNFYSGCGNISHFYQLQSLKGPHSPRQSDYTIT